MADFGHVPVVRGGQVLGSGSILTSGPSLPGEFAYGSFQRGHAGFKAARLSHAGTVERWPPPGGRPARVANPARLYHTGILDAYGPVTTP